MREFRAATRRRMTPNRSCSRRYNRQVCRGYCAVLCGQYSIPCVAWRSCPETVEFNL